MSYQNYFRSFIATKAI